ncbi:hypothetical protein H5410_015772 [Solanum commersonii]|uniref:Uncharacterized protein n=1 Tax=Solanum commersonii TaxID=4109 RepID=A0A9J5ZVE6_SOLCO|nr:hypothetical protein H5410_015772 [Solanum commersonii]
MERKFPKTINQKRRIETLCWEVKRVISKMSKSGFEWLSSLFNVILRRLRFLRNEGGLHCEGLGKRNIENGREAYIWCSLVLKCLRQSPKRSRVAMPRGKRSIGDLHYGDMVYVRRNSYISKNG